MYLFISGHSKIVTNDNAPFINIKSKYMYVILKGDTIFPMGT